MQISSGKYLFWYKPAQAAGAALECDFAFLIRNRIFVGSWLLFVRNSRCIVDVDRRPRTAAPTRQFRDAKKTKQNKTKQASR
jgi:hypothetical protein